MKISISIFIVYALCTVPVLAFPKRPCIEELLILPIIDLVYLSEYVMEGKPLQISYHNNNESSFLIEVTAVYKGKASILKDTLLVCYDHYTWPWGAICLYHEWIPQYDIAPDGHLTYYQYTDFPPPFEGPDAALFLLTIISDPTRCDFERHQAITHLSNCDNIASERYVLKTEDASKLLNGLLVYLKTEPNTAHLAYQACKCLTELPEMRHLREEVFIPFLKNYSSQVDDSYLSKDIQVFLEIWKK